MSPELIQRLEAMGRMVVRDRYVVVEKDGELEGLEEDGSPRVNRDKDGNIKDTFCVLPEGKAVRVFHGSSQSSLKAKISGNTPDIVRGKPSEEISAGSTGR